MVECFPPSEELVRISCCSKELVFYLPDAEDHIQKRIRGSGHIYEEDALLDIHSRKLKRGLIIDVGANIGNHAVFFGKVLKRRVLAFEPYGKAFQVLQKNVELNGLSEKVTVHPKAVGREAAYAELNEPPTDNWGKASIAVANRGAIEIVRLDDLGITDRVALIKIDVEGMELDVLDGAWRLLKRCRPVLYMEAQTSAQYSALKRKLRPLGYQMIRRFNCTPTYVFVYCRTPKSQIKALIEKTDALASLEDIAIATREMSRLLSRSEATLNQTVKTTLLAAMKEHRKAIALDARAAASESAKQVLKELEAHRLLFEQGIEACNAQIEKLAIGLRQQFAFQHDSLSDELRQAVAALNESLALLSGAKKFTASSSSISGDSANVCDPRGGVRLGLPVAKGLAAVWLPPQGVKRRPPLSSDRPGQVVAIGAASNCESNTRGEPDDLISVIMTTYNSAAYVRSAIENILAQSHRNLELIVVDDASTDDTFDVILELARRDARIRAVKSFQNRGTYWCKNLGITRAGGRYVTFQDSDDRSNPDRLSAQLRELQSTQAVLCTCNYVRVDSGGNVILNRGRRERKAIMAPLIDKHAVLARSGYFDSVRTSADDEFNRRIAIVFGHQRTVHIDRPYYQAADREGSLTNDKRTGSEIAREDHSPLSQSHLSPPRREYVRQFMAWHERLKQGASDPVIRFPLLRRPFPAPGILLLNSDQRESYVTASMASIPAREQLLAQTVNSILPQVDVLNVYLNGYDHTPSFLNHSKVHVVHSREYGDLRDNGKFFFLDSVIYGYHFTIDDDIIYPPDYVQKMILKIEHYNRQAIVGCHGVIFADPFIRFMDGRKVLHFKRNLDGDTLVNLLGSGTVAYHTSTMRLSLAEFKQPGMADVWLAITAKRQNVPMIAVQRREGWLVPLVEADETSLYAAAREDDDLQTAAIRNEGAWQLDSEYSSLPFLSSFFNRYRDDEFAAKAAGLHIAPLQNEFQANPQARNRRVAQPLPGDNGSERTYQKPKAASPERTALHWSTVDSLPAGATIAIHGPNRKAELLKSKIESARPDITIRGFAGIEPHGETPSAAILDRRDASGLADCQIVTNQTNWVQTAWSFAALGCPAIHVLPTFDPEHANRNCIVVHSARVIFVPIYKCAYSSFTEFFRHSFAEFDGRPPQTSLNSFIDLHDPEYDDYFKFSVVRDPVARVSSCFYDKFGRHENHHNVEQWEQPLLRLLGRDKLSFVEWLSLIEAMPDTHSDPHWRSQYSTLHNLAGQPLVDHVYRLENLSSHLPELSERLGLNVRLQHFNATARTRRKNSPEAAEIIRRRFENDFVTFGY